MPSNDPARRFQDILDNIDRIRRYLRGVSYEQFTAESEKYDAVAYCFLRLSEAASKLGTHAETLEPGIDWGQIRGLGNRLRHTYDGLDPRILWMAVENKFPELEQACRRALHQIASD